MSTLTIPTPRVSPESEVDARFHLLARLVPTQRESRDTVEFATVFDLDYGQPIDDEAPVATVHEIRPASLTAAEPARTRPSARRRVRLTRRGRGVVVLAFLGLALAVMIPMSGWATATLEGGSPEPVRVIEVHPGETLYGIAGDLAEPGQVREMVRRIQDLNSLPGSTITEGQKLAVPVG